MNIAPYRKFVVALLGAAIIIADELVAHFGQWWGEVTTGWITGIVAVVTAIGVFLVRNAPLLDTISTGGDPFAEGTGQRNPILDAADLDDDTGDAS